MNVKHTPGPWAVDSRGELLINGNPTGTMAADFSDGIINYHEAFANLTLAADAPALLEALNWALDQIEDDLDPDHQEALVAARSLVDKHQGRG